ncbi:MAG: hypothetical protein WC061_00535 [Melioribacteraceae bacterium]
MKSHFCQSLFRKGFFFLIIVIGFTSFLYSQAIIKSTSSDERTRMYKNHLQLKESSPFKNLNWQYVGPANISGRMTDVEVVRPRGKNYVIYAAGATGGVWKTTNEGTTWNPVFEHGQSTSIGDVTLAPSDQNIVWIGTGEANIFRSSNAGAGVFKSTDAGKSWKQMGLTGTNTIPRIVIHPKNPDIVYVAASGNEWTDNEERGLFKTENGGKTWNKIFYKDQRTGVIDLVMDPSDPSTIYLATWQRVRQKWNDPRNDSDYKNSSIYKSTDAGMTWKEISDGLPEAKFRGRIGIDISCSNTNVLYAFVDNYEILRANTDEENLDSYGRPKGGVIKGATVFRSNDKGNTWKQVSELNEYMEGLSATYGWVFGQIRVDPVNENKIYVMGLGLNVSEDGGKTFRELEGMHGDHHGLWIDPANTDYLVNVNDGGLAISYDGGKEWRTFADNMPLVQFFNVAADMSKPFKVYGSIQDHGSYKGIVDLSGGRNRIPAQNFERAPGGEGSNHAIDPANTEIVYSAGFYGTLARSDMKTGESKNIMPKIEKGQPKLRGQWLAPFIISPHSPNTLYIGYQYLFKSTDRGDTWEKISADLTYNDPKRSGDIPYQTIFSISESPLKAGLIYVGTDDGRVHVTKDGGKTWEEIVKGLPYGKWVSELVASAYDVNTVYMSQNGKRDDDFAPYLWRSTNQGETWESIINNLPTGPINVIKEDPKNKNILYAGNDFGVYVSLNGGKSWNSLPGKLPTTYVHDLVIHPRDNIMLAATHGRGLYALDVEYLQKIGNDDPDKKAFFVSATKGTLPINPKSRWSHPDPLSFCYYLRSDSEEMKIEIWDSNNTKVKELKGAGSAGLNFAEWDLTSDAKEKTYVEPGQYTLIIEAAHIFFKVKVEKPEKR